MRRCRFSARWALAGDAHVPADDDAGHVEGDRDFGRAMRMSKALDFGCVWINTHIPLVAEMPHGGYKKSGYGKDLSMYGFEDYTRVKHVMANIEG